MAALIESLEQEGRHLAGGGFAARAVRTSATVIRRVWLPVSLLVSLGLAVAACDSSKPDPTLAKAEDKKGDEVDFDKRMADRKAKREADEKVKAEADAAKKAAIAALCVLPDKKKIEKDQKKACAAVGVAHDKFMQKHFTGDVLDKWNAAKGTAMPMTVAQCTKSVSVEVAACQVNALETAPAELKDEVSALLRGCIEKFGPGSALGAAAAAGGVVPKKRPG